MTRYICRSAGVMLGLALAVMVLSSHEVHAQQPWGISLEPSTPSGCCEPPREFAQPPPPHRRPYRYRHIRRKRYRNYRYRRFRRRKPNVGFVLGRSRIWVNPEEGNLSWDLKLGRFWGEGHVEDGLWIGSNFRIVKMNGNRWFENIKHGDFTQQSRHWLDMDVSIRYKIWYFRGGWTTFREVDWSVPDNVARELAQESPGFDPTQVKNTLQGLGDNFLLPYAVTGLRAGPLQIEAGAQLLGWDLRSYRLFTSLTLSKWGLGVQLSAAYQRDGMRMRLSKDSDDDGDVDSDSLAQATWERSFWEISMAATADLSSLFGWSKNKWMGPLQLMVGVRYRNIQENRLTTTSDRLMFAEQPGSQWTFFAGLQVAFGHGNSVMMH